MKALEERERELIDSVCILRKLLPDDQHEAADKLVKAAIKEVQEALIAEQDKICTYSWRALGWEECTFHCPGKRKRDVHVSCHILMILIHYFANLFTHSARLTGFPVLT